jgi:hypothetical protein
MQVAQQIAKLKQHNQIKIRPAIISILLNLHIYGVHLIALAIYAIANWSIEITLSQGWCCDCRLHGRPRLEISFNPRRRCAGMHADGAVRDARLLYTITAWAAKHGPVDQYSFQVAGTRICSS